MPAIQADPKDRRRTRSYAWLFALVCGAWLLASLIIPALPVSEDIFFAVMLPSIFFFGSFWPAIAVWAAIPATAALVAAVLLGRRRYRAAAVRGAFAAVGALVMVYGSFLGDMIRFQVDKPAYDRVVADIEAGRCGDDDRRRWNIAVDYVHCADPAIVIFVWGGFVSAWHGVIYDAADEIAKPASDRSIEWKHLPIGALLSCSGVKVPLGGHYYRAGGSYVGGIDECG
jgi:hypothetical protein